MVAERPIARPHAVGRIGRQELGHNSRCVLRIGQFQAQAGKTAFKAVERPRVFDVGQRQRIVQFIEAGLHHAHYVELLQPRHHAGGRNVAFGRNHRYLAAHFRAQFVGQFLAEYDVELARFQIFKFAGRHFLPIIDDLLLFLRVYAAHLHAAHHAVVGQKRLVGDIGGGAEHVLIARHHFAQILPAAAVFRIVKADFGMRRDAEQLAAHVFLKAVHHRQDHNQRHHADGDADDGNNADKRHKAAAFFRPQIAQAYPCF